MKLLLTGDLHLNDNPRDAYRWTAFAAIRGIAHNHGVDAIFILGDFTDHADGHSAAFTNRVVDELVAATMRCPVYIIRGTPSHDGTDPQVPFFRFIRSVKNCHYIIEPMLWNSIALQPNGCWPPPPHDFIEAIFTHHTFGGAISEHGERLEGLRLPMDSPPIFSGDVHVPQKQGPVTYVGAPALMRFGDTYKPRVLIYDTEGGVHVQSIPMPPGPSKKLLQLVAEPDARLRVPSVTLVEGDLVKVRVSFAGAIPSIAHLRANIRDVVAGMGGVLHSVETIGLKPTGQTPTRPVSRSDHELVKQYAKAKGFDQPTTDAGLEIVK